jgi:hypothetical protein
MRYSRAARCHPSCHRRTLWLLTKHICDTHFLPPANDKSLSLPVRRNDKIISRPRRLGSAGRAAKRAARSPCVRVVLQRTGLNPSFSHARNMPLTSKLLAAAKKAASAFGLILMVVRAAAEQICYFVSCTSSFQLLCVFRLINFTKFS